MDCKLVGARSRLYRNQNLQVNMRSAAFFKLYKIYTLLHCAKINILGEARIKKSAIFVKMSATILQNLQNL